MSTEKKLVEQQKDLTVLAIEISKNFNIDLDFSNQSIKLVDEILDKLHKQYKKDNIDEGLQGVALEFSAYIITTIEIRKLIFLVFEILALIKSRPVKCFFSSCSLVSNFCISSELHVNVFSFTCSLKPEQQ